MFILPHTAFKISQSAHRLIVFLDSKTQKIFIHQNPILYGSTNKQSTLKINTMLKQVTRNQWCSWKRISRSSHNGRSRNNISISIKLLHSHFDIGSTGKFLLQVLTSFRTVGQRAIFLLFFISSLFLLSCVYQNQKSFTVKKNRCISIQKTTI